MRQNNSITIGEHIFQVEIIKAIITKRFVIFLRKLGFNKSAFIFERGIIFINISLCFNDDSPMYFSILTFNNQEVGGIDTYITPFAVAVFIALNFKFCHCAVTVVIYLKIKCSDIVKPQHFCEERLLKTTVGTIRQIVERTILLRMRCSTLYLNMISRI